MFPQQGGNGLGNVKSVRAELEPGSAVGAGLSVVRSAAMLLTCWPSKVAVAADDAVAGREVVADPGRCHRGRGAVTAEVAFFGAFIAWAEANRGSP